MQVFIKTTILTILGSILLMGCEGLGSASLPDHAFEAYTPIPQNALDYLRHPRWQDGKAELQCYDATLIHYTKPRQTDIRLIQIVEPFNRRKLVKAVVSSDDMKVMKLNLIQTFNTGTYDYRQMISMFFDCSNAQVIKATMSSQDGCGQTWLQLLKRNDQWLLTSHSYFDDTGDEQMVLDLPENIVFYDGLPLSLRFHLHEKTFSLPLLSSFIRSRFEKPIILQAQCSVNEDQLEGHPVFRVDLKANNIDESYVFQKEFPHRLLTVVKNGGEKWRLRRSHRLWYWQHTNHEDRDLVR